MFVCSFVRSFVRLFVWSVCLWWSRAHPRRYVASMLGLLTLRGQSGYSRMGLGGPVPAGLRAHRCLLGYAVGYPASTFGAVQALAAVRPPPPLSSLLPPARSRGVVGIALGDAEHCRAHVYRRARAAQALQCRTTENANVFSISLYAIASPGSRGITDHACKIRLFITPLYHESG